MVLYICRIEFHNICKQNDRKILMFQQKFLTSEYFFSKCFLSIFVRICLKFNVFPKIDLWWLAIFKRFFFHNVSDIFLKRFTVAHQKPFSNFPSHFSFDVKIQRDHPRTVLIIFLKVKKNIWKASLFKKNVSKTLSILKCSEKHLRSAGIQKHFWNYSLQFFIVTRDSKNVLQTFLAVGISKKSFYISFNSNKLLWRIFSKIII